MFGLTKIRWNFTGISFNLLVAAYSLLLAPFIADYIQFGRANIFVALFGVFIYVAEFFAMNYKLKVVRLRAETLRMQKHAREELPNPGCVIWYAVLMRMLFRIGFIMVALVAFGFDPSAAEQPVMFTVMLILFILCEVFVLGYTWVESGLFRTTPDDKWDEERDQKELETWRKVNLPFKETEETRAKEFRADIVLQLYALMLLTAFWDTINESNKEYIIRSFNTHETALFTGIMLFVIFLVMAFFALIPLRMAYWIEESVSIYTSKERWRLRGSLLIAALMVFEPSIKAFVGTFFS